MRIAVIDRNKCKPEKCGWACQKACPGVKMGDETITAAEGMPRINEELCTGCGLCVKKCPFKAIKIINLPQELEEPSFQYGPNSFRLYGFVLPKPKSVVGIIGVNGIGKTTALRLLKGDLKPNFGDFEKETPWEEVKRKTRGHEIQAYLESLHEGKARVAYKMQYVDELAKSKATCRELLEECDEKNAFKEVVKQSGLEPCLDRQLNQLSGGELQRTAVACCLLKDASVYFFDEPSSYLDARQRLAVAKQVRQLSKQASVVVVEHDLAVLDYLSDFVHVFYGAKAAYGAVSSLKSGRNGVNEFLEGFLKDENLRFRDHSIRFEVRRATTAGKGVATTRYEAMTKEFTDFVLDVEPGQVFENEVEGVLGPNAIGKTTFIKMLAGVTKPSKGASWGKQRVAFKPQQLKTGFKGTLRELLAKEKELDKEFFDSQARDKLGLEDLLDKQVTDLSGGEKQRLAIALCLSKKADYYLLDEPSAFLDVEQRLEAARLIRNSVERGAFFVVEHDLLFLDAVSDRIILFEGEPGRRGRALVPRSLREGMHSFLEKQGITFRRDPSTGRPRANKPGSRLDEEQKASGNYYYA